MRKTVVLRSPPHEIEVSPATGGSLLRFSTKLSNGAVWNWLRPAPENPRSALETACFPMVPFCNRIADARFRFGGRAARLSPNFPPEPHAIHGLGWQSSWQVAETTGKRAVLQFDHDGRGWPWPFTVTQTLTLTGGGLTIKLAVRNRSGKAMPSGLGLHPYFVRGGPVCINAPAQGLCINDARNLPFTRVTKDPLLDSLNSGGVLPLAYDNQISGWTGRAEIAWPDTGRQLILTTSPAVSRAVVFSPADEPFFCFEPVTHDWNALGASPARHAERGVVALAPGEMHTLSMTLSVSAAA